MNTAFTFPDDSRIRRTSGAERTVNGGRRPSIEALMAEDDRREGGFSQVRLQPRALRRGDVGVRPDKFARLVAHAVGAIARIEDDKVPAAYVAREPGAALTDGPQEIGFGSGGDAVVPENIQTPPGQFGERAVDGS